MKRSQKNQVRSKLRTETWFGLAALTLILLFGATTYANGPGSDEFDGSSLDTNLWTFIDPLNDSTMTVSGGQVSMSVPAGVLHYTWTGINSTPRIMQAAANEDFDLEVGFTSPVTQAYQLQGLRIEQGLDNSLVVQLSSNGSSTLMIYGQVFDGVVSSPVGVVLPGGTDHLRVQRRGNTFSLQHSTNGSNWSVAATVNRTLNVDAVGVIAGNYSAGSPPAHTAVADYFHKTTLPTIDTDPVDVNVTEPAQAVFNVSASGSGLSYQWLRNGSPISGATSSQLSVSPTSVSDNGAQYSATVTNSIGSVTSGAATLTVAAAPVPPTITSQPSSSTVTAPAGASFSVSASGTGPLSYQWLENGAAIPGANGTVYSVASTDVSDSGAQYSVTVSNAQGSVTSSAATLTVVAAPTPPSITSQPANVAVTAPDAAQFSVSADGDAPLAYQWRRNGVNIPGANASQLIISPTSGDDDGDQFSVVVSNGSGSATSASAALSVTVPPMPPAILVEPADVSVVLPAAALFTVSAEGDDPLSYQWRRDGVDIPGATGTSLEITPTALSDDAALISVVVSNAVGDAFSRDALLSVSEPPLTDAPNDEFNGTSLDTDLWTFIDPLGDATLAVDGGKLEMSVPAGASHYIWSGINSTPRIMQDAIDGDFELEAKFDSAVTTGYQMQGLRIEQDLDNSLSVQFNHNGSSVVALYGNVTNGVATSPTSTTISAATPLYMRVLRQGDTWTLSHSNDGNAWTVFANINRSLNVSSVGILVGNYSTQVAPAHTAVVDYFERRDLPVIDINPANVEVTAPAPAAFAVTASGVGPLSYQWRRNGVPINGATQTTYTVDPTDSADNGASFDVVVSNADGSVTSQAAVLTVNVEVVPSDPPVAQNDSYTLPIGGTLNTQASGLPSVLDNDVDPEGGVLTATLVDDVQHGDLTLYADGSFTYEHDGTDTPLTLLDPRPFNSLTEYGADSDIDGDTLVVGANSPEGIGPKTGAAYVYRRNGVTWELEAKLIPNVQAVRQWFGWSVAIEGDTIVVGAPGDPHAGVWSGAAFVFTRSGGGWTQQAKLVAPNPGAYDEFANAVSISGDTIAMGSYLDDAGEVNSGSVHIFQKNGSNWDHVTELLPATPIEDGWYGWDVDLDGDRLAVGSMFDNAAGADSGTVFVYERSAGVWAETAQINPTDAGPGQTFGFGVDLDGTSLVVGANDFTDGTGPASSGAAYVFDYNGTSWQQAAKFDGPAQTTTFGIFRFGVSVSIAGDTVAVGGHNDVGAPNVGAVYLYQRTNGAWSFSRKIDSPVQNPAIEFGVDVVLDGDYVVVGANRRKYSALPDDSAGGAYALQIGGTLLDTFTYVADDGSETSQEATVELQSPASGQ